MESDDASELRPRTAVVKVRTGCVTCKARRVKCDEGKPSCLRCQKAKAVCMGYADPPVRVRRKIHARIVRSSPREIAPRSPNTHDDDSSPENQELGLVVQSLCEFPDLSPQDAGYLSFFRHKLLDNAVGFHTTDLWRCLVSGIALQGECLQLSALAIGALIRSSESTQAINSAARGDHLRVALSHHLQAVRKFRSRVQTLSLSRPDQVLMVTILLVIFELIQGHVQTAHAFLSSSLTLLDGFIGQAQPATSLGLGTLALADTYEMSWILPTLSVMSRISQGLSNRELKRTTRYIDLEFQFPEPATDPIVKLFNLWGRFLTYSLDFLAHTFFEPSEIFAAQDMVEILSIHTRLSAHLGTWSAVMRVYEARRDIDDSSKATMRIARIHWRLLHVALSCCLDTTQMVCDRFLEDYKALTFHCIALCQSNRACGLPTSVMLGQGIIVTLCAIVRTCRHHDVRMMAAETLRHLPCSMVAWDTRHVLNGMLGAVLLEEECRGRNGIVAAEARWRWVRKDRDGEAEVTKFSYVGLVPSNGGFPTQTLTMPKRGFAKNICKIARCSKDHVSSAYKDVERHCSSMLLV